MSWYFNLSGTTQSFFSLSGTLNQSTICLNLNIFVYLGVTVGFYILIIPTCNRQIIFMQYEHVKLPGFVNKSVLHFPLFISRFHEILLIFSLPQNKRSGRLWCSAVCYTQAVVPEEQMGCISCSAVLSHFLSHRMMAHNGPSRFLRYTNRRWDAKLEENWFNGSEDLFVSLATKFQTISPKRSAADRELLKNDIPPTHFRPPWSLFNFLAVALVGVWESGGLVTTLKGRWQRWNGSSRSCSRTTMTGKGEDVGLSGTSSPA